MENIAGTALFLSVVALWWQWRTNKRLVDLVETLHVRLGGEPLVEPRPPRVRGGAAATVFLAIGIGALVLILSAMLGGCDDGAMSTPDALPRFVIDPPPGEIEQPYVPDAGADAH